MSEPTDINDNDPTDDNELSSLYARASKEKPSKALDAAILNKAQREVEKTTRPSPYFPIWTQSLSVAAVMVLSVTVLLMIEKESPEVLNGLEDSTPVVIIEQGIEQTTEQERETTDQLQEKLLARAPAHQEEKKQAKDVDTNITTDVATGVASKFATRPKSVSESVVMMNKAIPSKTIAPKKREAPTLEADAKSVAGFSRSELAPRAMGIVAERLTEETKEVISCQQLTEKDCFESAACTLHQNKELKTYHCLPARDHCELMFRQSEGTKENCEAKQGCVFVPTQCYCPPDVFCECSGGEPPQCKIVKQQ